MGSLVWFRSDLRVYDNPALHEAVERSPGQVAGLFVATPEQWARHDWGPPKIDFVARSVRSLGEDLAARRIVLRIVTCPSFAEVPEAVLRAARDTGTQMVLVNQELEVNERGRDAAVREELSRAGIEWRALWDQTVVPPADLSTSDGDPYQVFTPFHRRWRQHLQDQELGEPLPAPALAEEPVPGPVGEMARPEGVSGELADLWPAGEGEARERLACFLEGSAARYDEARDDPTRDTTSVLSPYLAVGAVSARTALWRALEWNEGRLEGRDSGLEAWMRQLAWRDFYRHVLVGFPRVSKDRPFRPETEEVAWLDDPDGLEAWKEGRTGFPIVDASMRCLRRTGWLHNRLRMIVASFLTKDLLIHWREGERHFNQHLVDADLANNNGGWQWAASTGTDAAPYFRVFNPWSQSQRFDPDGELIRRFVPELSSVPARALHDPGRLQKAVAEIEYPEAIVDHAMARRRAIAAFRAL